MCKALAERIIIEKSMKLKPREEKRFVVVRYGNVINSRGSLLPKFHEIGMDDSYDSYPVTDPRMTRFFMRLEDSVDLIEYALFEGKNGMTYVPNLKSYSIKTIAEEFGRLYEKPIKYTGMRAGEKIHEELVNEMELRRTTTNKNGKYFCILPFYAARAAEDFELEVARSYTSENCLSSDLGILKKYIKETDESI